MRPFVIVAVLLLGLASLAAPRGAGRHSVLTWVGWAALVISAAILAVAGWAQS